MKQSEIYLVEIFDRNFEYITSCQVSSLKYEFDYLSLSKNKINVPLTGIDNGYWLRITNMKKNIVGIIDSITKSKSDTTIVYKDVLSICDVNVYKDVSDLLSGEISVETWITEALRMLYVDSEDILQLLPLLSISATSKTYITGILELENINNLHELLQTFLIKYNVTVAFDIDMKHKGIVCTIGKTQNQDRYIEADLPNVTSKNIEFGKCKTSAINKIIIINEENTAQQQTFYLLSDNTISTMFDDSLRIEPVVFDYKSIKVSDDESFTEKAFAQAEEKLLSKDYNNLIELELMADDDMNDPLDWEIGQKGMIISEDKIYTSIFTGYSIEDGAITMIFGAVRNELTKKLKRRITA